MWHKYQVSSCVAEQSILSEYWQLMKMEKEIPEQNNQPPTSQTHALFLNKWEKIRSAALLSVVWGAFNCAVQGASKLTFLK